MQSRSIRFVVSAMLAAVSLTAPIGARADNFPDYLAKQYQSYFARYVDNRSLPEHVLNAIRLSSKEYGRGFALVAGVSKYPSMAGAPRDLVPASEDIRKLVNYLITVEKFDEIVVLKDADVTDANLSYFLQRYFPRRLQEFPKSRFLFAYSGHGATVNNRGYLLTSEARSLTDVFNGIPMNTVRAMFQQVVDSGFHVLALINACYSGDFVRRSFGGETRFIPKYAGAHAITAGGTGELTWHDGSIGTGSVFFEKFFAALDGRAGREGIVTVDELSAYLRREVQISTDQRQNPLPGDLSRDGSLGGFFFLNRRPLIESRIVPEWDAGRGIPFGDSLNLIHAPAKVYDALEDQYDRYKALVNRMEALGQGSNFDQAIADFTAEIRRDPNYAPGFVFRGAAYGDRKDYIRAIADFDEAIRLQPNYAVALYLRGKMKYNVGDASGAAADTARAKQLDPAVELGR